MLSHGICRYLSMVLIIVSNTGFFYDHFSPETCIRYAYVAPVFKSTALVPYDVWTPEADKSSSAPDHGVPRNTEYSVSLDHPVPCHRL